MTNLTGSIGLFHCPACCALGSLADAIKAADRKVAAAKQQESLDPPLSGD